MIDNTPPQWPDERGYSPGPEDAGQPGSVPPPPPPPDFTPRTNSSFMRNMLRGLGIALTGCIAVVAGLFGACFAMMGGNDIQMLPATLGSLAVFIVAALSLYFLIRPRRRQP